MLNSTQIVFEGNLATDPAQLRFVETSRGNGEGRAVTELVVLVNHRKRNSAGEWVDGEPTRWRVSVWGELAENAAASLTKGSRVLVAGEMSTEAYPDPDTGEKRTAQKVTATALGYSLRKHTVVATKARPAAEPGAAEVEEPPTA